MVLVSSLSLLVGRGGSHIPRPLLAREEEKINENKGEIIRNK